MKDYKIMKLLKLSLLLITVSILNSCTSKDEVVIEKSAILYNNFDTLLYADTSLQKIDTLVITNIKDTIIFEYLRIYKNKKYFIYNTRKIIEFTLHTDSIIKTQIQTLKPKILIEENPISIAYIERFEGYDKVYIYEYPKYIFYLNNFEGLVGYKNKQTNETKYLYKHLPYKN